MTRNTRRTRRAGSAVLGALLMGAFLLSSSAAFALDAGQLRTTMQALAARLEAVDRAPGSEVLTANISRSRLNLTEAQTLIGQEEAGNADTVLRLLESELTEMEATLAANEAAAAVQRAGQTNAAIRADLEQISAALAAAQAQRAQLLEDVGVITASPAE